MDFKNHGIRFADIIERLFIQALQLLYRSILCLLKPGNFPLNIVDMCPLDHFIAALIKHKPADRHSAEYTFTA